MSSDQTAFESFELKGGAFTLYQNIPVGGGVMTAQANNYFYSVSSGGLNQSPLTAPQYYTPVYTSLNKALPVPTIWSTRVLQSKQIFVSSTKSKSQVTYSGTGVRIDWFADDGKTLLYSVLRHDFATVPLSGAMAGSSQEFQAVYPVTNWIYDNNFSANARWQSGAAYSKNQVTRLGDTVFVEDCPNVAGQPSNTASIIPCVKGQTLDNFFPRTLINSWPYETDFASDGTVSTVQGVRMWVANTPISLGSNNTLSYRVFFELNGNIYIGFLQKNGTPFYFSQADGTVVNYNLRLNQAAVSSIQQGLILAADNPGSQAGNAALGASLDLFGIGGHGVNGSLAPADLRTHYSIPVNLTGTGQTIAIVDPPGLGDVQDDLNVFSQHYGLPQCNTSNPCYSHIDLSNGASPLSGWGSERALDVQMVHAIAPGAKILQITAASNSLADMIAAAGFAAQQPGVVAVSISYCSPEPNQQTGALYESNFASAQSSYGMIFFASSGDEGRGVPYYPATSAYVTGVGGTRINSVGLSLPTNNEVAWQFSGGDFMSNFVSKPAWQSQLPGAYASATNRLFPDVAGVADFQHSGFAIYYRQAWMMGGGTSAATPMWAGIAALIGESMANSGKSLSALVKTTPGGFNGLLYQIKGGGAFVDITAGSNNLLNTSCDWCNASQGYDGVTGLGVPNVGGLLSSIQLLVK